MPQNINVSVAIIGAGPAGVGMAVGLAQCGLDDVWLIDRASSVGGVPARYSDEPTTLPTFIDFPRCRVTRGCDYARNLEQRLERTPTRLCLDTTVVKLVPSKRLLHAVSAAHGFRVIHAEAIVIATGAREQTIAERGWITGARCDNVMHTMQLIDWFGQETALPGKRPLILGSDLIAYSTAAKLQATGLDSVALADHAPHPQCPWPARLYFRRWGKPTFHHVPRFLEINGDECVAGATIDGMRALRHDLIIISGNLVPNRELLEASPSEVPSACGLFIVGNACGGFQGAHSCYRQGLRTASVVHEFLNLAG